MSHVDNLCTACNGTGMSKHDNSDNPYDADYECQKCFGEGVIEEGGNFGKASPSTIKKFKEFRNEYEESSSKKEKPKKGKLREKKRNGNK